MTLQSPAGGRVNRRMLATGAGLAAAGGMIGFAGVALAGVAVLGATRRWMARFDGPRDAAAHKLRQARRASRAGVQAWRDA